METNYTYTLTPDDLYKFDWRKEVEGCGYEVVRFGTFKPESDERFYLTPGGVIKNCSDWKGSVYPRLILREKQPKRFIFEECQKNEAKDDKGLYLISKYSEDLLVFRTAFPEMYIYEDYVFVKRIEGKE